MIAMMLVMIAGGVGFAQAVSDPRAVTLRWLRLGGIIGVTLLAVAATTVVMGGVAMPVAGWVAFGLTAGAVVLHLTLIQLGRARWQGVIASAAWVMAAETATILALTAAAGAARDDGMRLTDPATGQAPAAFTAPAFVAEPGLAASLTVGSAVAGGALMTMLLGHAYLTAGSEMTQRPFRRLVLALAAALAARAALSVALGLLPWLGEEHTGLGSAWDTMTVTTRYLVGLAVPAVFLYMIHDCVRRRSNQSATGILYVATVLVLIGEGAALALFSGTGRVF